MLKATPDAKKRKLICVVRNTSPKITTNYPKFITVLPEFVFDDVSSCNFGKILEQLVIVLMLVIPLYSLSNVLLFETIICTD